MQVFILEGRDQVDGSHDGQALMVDGNTFAPGNKMNDSPDIVE